MSHTIQTTFQHLFSSYSEDTYLSTSYWTEIELHYKAKNRHHHNLIHLEHVINELKSIQAEVMDWDVLLFSVFYHDIVYQSTAKDNEEKSAAFAQKRLARIQLPETKITRVINQILATKTHAISSDLDTNYFLDADLSILGQEWESYEKYSICIKKEYAIYPDFLYNLGRKKALIHFLAFEDIFKTTYFKEKYEKQARINIEREIESLTSFFL